MSRRARLYPLLTLCTLGCPLPTEPGDATATLDDSTSDASSSTGTEEPSTSEWLPTTTSGEDPTTTGSTGISTSTSTSAEDEPDAPPAAPSLVLDYAAIKQFHFSWEPVAGAEYYQLLERPYPEVPGWSQLGTDLVETSTTRSMPIHLRVAASYMLRACNQAGCSESEPVKVDPGIDDAIGYFKASNAEEDDAFGVSLAISADGSTLVVGASYEDSGAHSVNGEQFDNSSVDRGAAYVFVREGDTWTQQAYLKAFNGDQYDRFDEVAISANGDTIAVGASGESSATTGIGGDPDDNSAEYSGAVYVFERNAGAWSQTEYLKASNTHPGAAFGDTVALSADGNTLAVGAKFEGSGATGVDANPWSSEAEKSGAAYVYSRTADGWEHRAYLKASNAGAWDQFGRAIALSGDGTTLAVGAPEEGVEVAWKDGNQLDYSQSSGAVYMFTLEDGKWTQQAYLKASNPGERDGFGSSVALSLDGDILAVGAFHECSAATEIDGDQWNDDAYASGAVYTFSRQGQTWQQDAYIKAPNTNSGDYFGESLAMSADGGVLVVGAPWEKRWGVGSFADPSEEEGWLSGAAYVFTRVAGAWTHRQYLKAPNPSHGNLFGSAVSVTADGGTLVIGDFAEESTSTGIGGNQHTPLTENWVGAVYMY